MNIQPANITTIATWVQQTLENNPPPDAFWLPLLFAGDRLRPVDAAFVAREGNTITGAVTLSMHGETGEGPEIIGLYVLPPYRRKGVGSRLLLAAYNELLRRGARQVRVVILSPAARRLVLHLPAPHLQIIDPLGA